MKNFEQILDNIFQPLFAATNDPKSYPQLHAFLQYVSDFHVHLYKQSRNTINLVEGKFVFEMDIKRTFLDGVKLISSKV